MKRNKALVIALVVIEILLGSCDRMEFAEDRAYYYSSNSPHLQVGFPPPPFIEDDDFGDFPLTGEIPFPICGNGRVEPTEQCDDGNDDNQDGCNVLCLFPVCGNGAVELGEQCDDTTLPNPAGCSADCVYMVCGNKRVEKELGEECDDGNLKSGDGCSPCCKFEMCGNMVLDPLEECDAGLTGGSGCTDCCKLMTSGTSTDVDKGTDAEPAAP